MARMAMTRLMYHGVRPETDLLFSTTPSVS
jgi:hypothetical protein